MIKKVLISLKEDFISLGKVSLQLLALVFITDLAFLLLHLLAAFFLRDAENFRFYLISKDFSYAEVFQYLKFFWTALLLFGMARKFRSSAFLLIGFLFVYFLADDLLGVHEVVGHIVKNNYFEESTSKLPIAITQAFFSLGVFLGFLGLLFLSGIQRSGERQFKFIRNLILLVVLLAFFGVGVDFVHTLYKVVLNDSEYVNQMLALIEDWGEMLVATGILAYVWEGSQMEKTDLI